jgi:hypothetical protein
MRISSQSKIANAFVDDDIPAITSFTRFNDRYFDMAVKIVVLCTLPCGVDVLFLQSNFPTMEVLIGLAIVTTIVVVPRTVRKFRTLFVPVLTQTTDVY